MTEYSFKEGDLVTLRLSEYDAQALNEKCGTAYSSHEIISHTPVPKFDWSTVKEGMAFKDGKDIFWYAAPFYKQEETHVIVFNGVAGNGYPHTPSGKMKKFLIRAPEHDIKD